MINPLLQEIRQCTICASSLPLGPNPVVSAHSDSKIVVIGQAPGSVVHQTGVPWDDASGNRLRDWLGVTEDVFYTPEIFALIPMGFCYPGKGRSGDLPPRPECAPKWHGELLGQIHHPQLILLIGTYAQQYYLGNRRKNTLTETVKNYMAYSPDYLPLPHPSPRNNIWLKKNPWFESEVIDSLRHQVKSIINS